MNVDHLKFLCCPNCSKELSLTKSELIISDKIIKQGNLQCISCKLNFPIKDYIPRFVSTKQSEVISFGHQWNNFPLSQIDEKTNTDESSIRLFSETTLSKDNIKNKSIIEIGCGAGRFLNVINNYQPKLLIGVDASNAVDSISSHLNLQNKNLLIIQADIFNLPFKYNNFDHVFSIGVIHHTPKPFMAFKKIALLVKEGGSLSISVYENSLAHRTSKNSVSLAFYDFLWAANLLRCEIYRGIFSRLPSLVQIYYCKLIIPILHQLNKIPIIRFLRYLLPSTCYRYLPVSFSIVDTMDTYATKIVHQYRAKTIYFWFESIGFNPVLLLSRDGWVSISSRCENINNFKIKNANLKNLPRSRF